MSHFSDAQPPRFNLSDALKNVEQCATAQDILSPMGAIISPLEALAKIHPFIAIAVQPFQAMINLERRRRENDRRILVLVTQIADVINVLRELPSERIPPAHHKQLEDLMLFVKVSSCAVYWVILISQTSGIS
jgi:hypothetical protein